MQAIVGTDPAMVDTRCGVFTPGTLNATTAGLDPLLGQRSLDRARAMMKDAGYTNGPMRLIGPTDLLAPTAMTQVAWGPVPPPGLQPGPGPQRLGHGDPAPRQQGAAGQGRLVSVANRVQQLRFHRPGAPPDASRQRGGVGRAGPPSRSWRRCATSGSTRRTMPRAGRCARTSSGWRWTRSRSCRWGPTWCRRLCAGTWWTGCRAVRSSGGCVRGRRHCGFPNLTCNPGAGRQTFSIMAWLAMAG